MDTPTRRDVHEQLMGLLRGDLPRETVAAWASRWIVLDDPGVQDEVVWKALKHLAGADLKVGPDEYLHSEQDMHSWIDEVENAEQ